MTAKALQGDRERCLTAGMDDYISKPVRLEDFAAALTRWVPVEPTSPLKETTEVQPGEESLREAEGDDLFAALNPATVQRLKELAQATDASLFARLLETFQSDAAERIAALRQAAEGDDAASLKQEAHALKGASLNIGALGMGDICQRLEDLGFAQTVDGATGLVTQLERKFSRVKREIERELNR